MFEIDENSIIKTFSNVCFITFGVLFLFVVGLEITGKDGFWLAYRALHFAIYGIYSLGLYKIIKLLTQLIGEMKFFRHHYILKDKKQKGE
jgi:hypothetical protein